MNKRELPSHLGTPHTMEVITSEFSLGGISDHEHGGKVVTAHKRDDFIDYVTRKYIAITPCKRAIPFPPGNYIFQLLQLFNQNTVELQWLEH